MVVAVLVVAGLEGLHRRAAVAGHVEEDVHLVDPIGVAGRGLDLLIVVGAGAAGDVTVPLLPALAPVARAVEAALLLAGFDRGVDQGGVGGRDGEPDPSHVPARQAGLQPAPGLAVVAGLPEPRAGSPAEKPPDVAPALVGRGIDHLRVGGIEFEVGDAGVLVDLERRGPGGAAIGGAVDAALPARRPKRPLGGHENTIAVARVHQDAADVLRPGEAHPLPGAAGVAAAVDPVSPADMAPTDVLAGADPDDVGVGGVESDLADRIGRLVFENGRPGGARVGGLP